MKLRVASVRAAGADTEGHMAAPAGSASTARRLERNAGGIQPVPVGLPEKSKAPYRTIVEHDLKPQQPRKNGHTGVIGSLRGWPEWEFIQMEKSSHVSKGKARRHEGTRASGLAQKVPVQFRGGGPVRVEKGHPLCAVAMRPIQRARYASTQLALNFRLRSRSSVGRATAF